MRALVVIRRDNRHLAFLFFKAVEAVLEVTEANLCRKRCALTEKESDEGCVNNRHKDIRLVDLEQDTFVPLADHLHHLNHHMHQIE